jgi:hypothetical protein
MVINVKLNKEDCGSREGSKDGSRMGLGKGRQRLALASINSFYTIADSCSEDEFLNLRCVLQSIGAD